MTPRKRTSYGERGAALLLDTSLLDSAGKALDELAGLDARLDEEIRQLRDRYAQKRADAEAAYAGAWEAARAGGWKVGQLTDVGLTRPPRPGRAGKSAAPSADGPAADGASAGGTTTWSK